MGFIGSAELPRVLTPVTRQRLGISRSRTRTELRRGNWQRLSAGILLTRPDPPTRADWADVGVTLAGPGAAVTGWDAARARGLGAQHPPSQHVVVLSRTAMNRVVGGVRIRRTDRAYRSRLQPLNAPLELIPLVGIARAVTDTAFMCRDLGTVRALIGAALQRRACSLPELLAGYEAGPRGGSRLLRTALTDMCDGARSAAEATAARRMARGDIPPFELNVPIADEDGRLVFVVDALWRELRAALEIDSREYHFAEKDWETTMRRHNALTRCGLAVAHYPPRSVVARNSTFVTETAEWLRRRAAELDVPMPSGRGVRRPPLDGTSPPFVVRLRS
jgi:hypothetical protein